MAAASSFAYVGFNTTSRPLRQKGIGGYRSRTLSDVRKAFLFGSPPPTSGPESRPRLLGLITPPSAIITTLLRPSFLAIALITVLIDCAVRP
jgi:hypothetical protein